jgi:guanylate kinase
MMEAIKRDEFIETAEYSGNFYGTSKKSVADVQRQNKVCVLDIDMQGVRSIKKTELNPIYVFIKPPSVEELEKRLTSRNTETLESVQKRLAMAKEEMEYASNPGIFDHVVVNETVGVAYNELKDVIIQEVEAIRKFKEQMTVSRQ